MSNPLERAEEVKNCISLTEYAVNTRCPGGHEPLYVTARWYRSTPPCVGAAPAPARQVFSTT